MAWSREEGGDVNTRFRLTHILVVCEPKGSFKGKKKKKTNKQTKKHAYLGKTRMVKHYVLEFIFPPRETAG